MPHLDQIHLPPQGKRELYSVYVGEAKLSALPTFKLKGFYKHLKELQGSFVKIPKQKAFTECKTCEANKRKRSRTVDKALLYSLKVEHALHCLHQANERRKYYKHQGKSRRNRSKYLSIIIDGMDQLKTSFLRLKRDTQKTAGLEKVPLSLIGAIVHGHRPHSLAFLFPGDFPKDSSMTTQVILETIRRVQADGDGKLPDTLYLQLDNTTRENKNSTIVFLCHELVRLGVFKKVRYIYPYIFMMFTLNCFHHYIH